MSGIDPPRRSIPACAAFDRGHLDHFALGVPDDATFQELRRRLVEHGPSDGAVTDFGSARSVWFHDPDGHGSEIILNVAGAVPRTFDERIVEPYESVEAVP